VRDEAVEQNAKSKLADELGRGLAAPICLTWELTYGCNLACTHCLSSSGRRDRRELSSAEAVAFIAELAAMQVFYVNVGGGEPMLRPDFFELLEEAALARVGVKFSTNGTLITDSRARRLASMSYLDVQVSVDGARPETNDPVRGGGTFDAAVTAMRRLAGAGFGGFKLSTVVTRLNAGELDELLALANTYGAQLRLARLRPAGRGATTWHQLRPTAEQLVELHRFLVRHPEVLTGDSFFHLGALGESLAGLNMCGAGRVVCLVDPVGDVYACPFVMHPDFRAGSVRDPGGFGHVWRGSQLFAELREPESGGACNSCGAFDACRGGCMAAKFFTGLPLDGPDPECVLGHGEKALALLGSRRAPAPGPGHSKPGGVRVSLGERRQ
jgi:mycofactocin radical SAM maturase